jgi:hypothetical protein
MARCRPWLAVAVAWVAWTLQAIPVSAEEPLEGADSPEEWFVMVTLKREVLPEDMEILVRGEVPYLPLTEIAELILVPLERSGGVIRGTIHTQDRGFAVAAARREILINSDPLPVPQGAMLPRGDEVYLRGDLLKPLFDLQVEFNPMSGSLRLTSDVALPHEVRRAQLQLRERRLEERAQAVRTRRVDLPYEAFTFPLADVSLSMGSRRPGGAVGYSALLAGDIAYMTGRLALSGDMARRPRDLRFTLGRDDPDGAVFGFDSLTEVWTGDVTGVRLPLVGGVGGGRGITFSSFPLERPDALDRTTIDGDTTPGWEVELYQNEQLVDFQIAGADGRYSFEDVPLEFGANRFRIVAYGPQGQVQEETREIGIGTDLVPVGETRYRFALADSANRMFASLTEAGSVPPRWTSAFEIEHGLSRAITLRGFAAYGMAESASNSDRRLTVGGEILHRTEMLNLGFAGALQENGGFGLRATGFARLGEWSVAGEASTFRRFESPLARDGSRRISHAVRLRASRSLTSEFLGPSIISGSARVISFSDGLDFLEIDGSLRHRLGPVSLSHTLSSERAIGTPDGSKRDSLSYTASASYSHRDLSVFGSARFQSSNKSLLPGTALRIRYRLDEQSNLSANLSVSPQPNRAALSATYTRLMEQGSVSLSGGLDSDGRAQVALGVNFSFGRTRSGRNILGRRPMGERGIVLARAFHTDSGRDRFEPASDEPLQDVVLTLNGRNRRDLTTDKAGTSTIFPGSVKRPILIGIDSRSLPDPFSVPAWSAWEVLPRSGRIAEVDLPVVNAGEVSGTLWAFTEAEGIPMADIELQVVDSTGNTLARARSLTDGFYLLEQIPPGRYSLVLAPEQEVRGVALATRPREILIGAEGTILDFVDLELNLPQSWLTEMADPFGWDP